MTHPAIELMQKWADEDNALRDVYDKAVKFKTASLAYATHRSFCPVKKGGCEDEFECDDAVDLWMAEYMAEQDLFDSIRAAQPRVQLTGATDTDLSGAEPPAPATDA